MEKDEKSLVPVRTNVAAPIILAITDFPGQISGAFHDLTDKALYVRSTTLASFAALILSVAILMVGTIETVPTPDGIQEAINWYSWVGLILAIYAGLHGLIASCKANFDTSQLSARSVMIWMYCSTSLCFDWAGHYLHSGLTAPTAWADYCTVNWTFFAGGPIATAVFAFVYILYVKNVKNDMITAEGNSRRRWSGRKAIVCMSGISGLLLVYNAVTAATHGGDLAADMGTLIAGVVVFVVVYVLVDIFVPIGVDRGIRNFYERAR